MRISTLLFRLFFTLLILLTGCGKENISSFSENTSTFRILVSIGAAQSSSDETKVSLTESSLEWNGNDKIQIVEVDDNGEFGECFDFTIDSSSIWSTSKTAEFVGATLTEGKNYIAFIYTNVGSVISDTDYGISKNYVSGYNYDNFDSDNFDILMYSDIFQYQGESLPSIGIAPISTILAVNIVMDGYTDDIGDLKSLEISNSLGRNIFLSDILFDSNGERVDAFNSVGSQYGATSSILANFAEPLAFDENQELTVYIPLSWNNYLSYMSNTLVFTVTTTENYVCSSNATTSYLEDGALYNVSFFFQVESDLSSIYQSSDYSQDGEVTQLQAATVGSGINLVIVGDGFADKDMEEYDERMSEAMEYFFSEEPYITYRDRFNVYSVKAISKNEGITSSGETVFSTEFGDGTFISGDDQTVFNYALKVPSISSYNDLHIITVLNSSTYAGTCYMYTNGASIAYCPIIYNKADNFCQVVVHEAGGHGFGKLHDEYDSYGGTIPNDEITSFNKQLAYGWNANVDITADSSSIQWAHMLSDSRYDGYVGIYEGAMCYEYGAYRPSEESIMRHNTGGYNAPSREAIYKRIMELSGSTYSYEEFVAYDAINRTEESVTKNAQAAAKVDISKFVPLNPPVLVESDF
ncbi:MAG: M64 family metallopeptidase [Rikenellaceae bacterium]